MSPPTLPRNIRDISTIRDVTESIGVIPAEIPTVATAEAVS